MLRRWRQEMECLWRKACRSWNVHSLGHRRQWSHIFAGLDDGLDLLALLYRSRNRARIELVESSTPTVSGMYSIFSVKWSPLGMHSTQHAYDPRASSCVNSVSRCKSISSSTAVLVRSGCTTSIVLNVQARLSSSPRRAIRCIPKCAWRVVSRTVFRTYASRPPTVPTSLVCNRKGQVASMGPAIWSGSQRFDSRPETAIAYTTSSLPWYAPRSRAHAAWRYVATVVFVFPSVFFEGILSFREQRAHSLLAGDEFVGAGTGQFDTELCCKVDFQKASLAAAEVAPSRSSRAIVNGSTGGSACWVYAAFNVCKMRRKVKRSKIAWCIDRIKSLGILTRLARTMGLPRPKGLLLWDFSKSGSLSKEDKLQSPSSTTTCTRPSVGLGKNLVRRVSIVETVASHAADNACASAPSPILKIYLATFALLSREETARNPSCRDVHGNTSCTASSGTPQAFAASWRTISVFPALRREKGVGTLSDEEATAGVIASAISLTVDDNNAAWTGRYLPLWPNSFATLMALIESPPSWTNPMFLLISDTGSANWTAKISPCINSSSVTRGSNSRSWRANLLSWAGLREARSARKVGRSSFECAVNGIAVNGIKRVGSMYRATTSCRASEVWVRDARSSSVIGVIFAATWRSLERGTTNATSSCRRCCCVVENPSKRATKSCNSGIEDRKWWRSSSRSTFCQRILTWRSLRPRIRIEPSLQAVFTALGDIPSEWGKIALPVPKRRHTR